MIQTNWGNEGKAMGEPSTIAPDGLRRKESSVGWSWVGKKKLHSRFKKGIQAKIQKVGKFYTRRK